MAGASSVLVLLALALWAATRGPQPAAAPAARSAIAVGIEVPAQGGGGPISVTALEPVWIKVYEKSGDALFMGELAPRQSYQLPDDAADAMLWTGRPHAVEVRLGDTLLPVLGPPDRPLKDISLDRAALLARIPPPPPLPPVKS